MSAYLEYIPPAARAYCTSVSERYTFTLVLKKSRTSKLGDFRHDRSRGSYTISVNKNLNPYQFLLTFLHELAHLQVALDHPRSAKAHGPEWKKAFKELMQPVLQEEIFPQPLLTVLQRHMRNPKAAAGSDPELWNALQAYNRQPPGCQLASLTDGDKFIFRNKQFNRIEKKRTRFLCREAKTRRLYLIPGIAEVAPL